eukprot:SAG11_NODE_336_length_10544_cov_9.794926_2_plen_134_part_00
MGPYPLLRGHHLAATTAVVCSYPACSPLPTVARGNKLPNCALALIFKLRIAECPPSGQINATLVLSNAEVPIPSREIALPLATVCLPGQPIVVQPASSTYSALADPWIQVQIRAGADGLSAFELTAMLTGCTK